MKHICFVCGHPIQKHPVYLPKCEKYPEGVYRHVRCEPGSKRWWNSKHGKASEFYDYFPEPKEKEDERTNVETVTDRNNEQAVE